MVTLAKKNMGLKKRGRGKRRVVVAVLFVVMFFVAFFGFQFFSKTGIFKIPGVVIFDESVTDAERAQLSSLFRDDLTLDSDVTISARSTFSRPELGPNEILSGISVAVTDFYSAEENVDFADVSSLLMSDTKIIDLSDLDFRQKLLKINGEYYLDEFDAGAVFRVISFQSEKFDQEIKPLIAGLPQVEEPASEEVLTIAQTGVTALSRGMNEKLKRVGDAKYFAEGIGEFLSSFDLTHTSNEASFSDFATSRNICSDARFIDTLLAIGLDIVELTGNHNQDCGDDAARNTIDVYDANSILHYGGGRTADEAAIPLEINEKQSKITMLAYNLSTGGATYDSTPGANQFYEEVAAEQIAAAKARGDFVIVDIQYYECNAYAVTTEDTTCDYAGSSYGDQVGFFRHLIDLGADVVVGTSAHQPQTFELYGDGAIYYGLGNLFFDQIWWPGTTRSLVLVHYFYKNKLLQTQIRPTVYDDAMQTRLMDSSEAKWFIERLASERP